MENLSLLSRKKLTLDKFLSEVKVAAEKEIKEVLSHEIKAVVINKECVGQVLSIVGKVAVNMLYLSTENTVESSRGEAEFSYKQKITANLDDVYASDDAVATLSQNYGTEVCFAVEHSVNVSGSYEYNFPAVVEDDSLVAKKKTFVANRLLKTAEDTFVVAEEVDTNLSSAVVLQAIANTSSFEINPSVDKVVIEGKVVAEVVYAENDTLGSLKKEFEYRQEVACDGVLPNMLVSADLETLNITVTPEEKEGRNSLVFAIDVHTKAYVFEETNYEVMSDVFSLSNNLQTTYDYVCVKNFVQTHDVIENTLSVTDVSNIDDLEDIISVYGAKFNLLSIENEDEKAIISGEISADALYVTQNSFGSIKVKKDVKFEIEKEKNQDANCASITASVSSFKVKAGKDLEVSFELDGSVVIEEEIGEEFVKSFENVEEKQNRFAGIKVYITGKGETLFDIAKAIGVKPETIAAQNDNMEVFEPGEKIYVYSPINLM